MKMDSYDVHIHPIKFHLYDTESFWTFNIIKNILKYNTILLIRLKEFKGTTKGNQNLYIEEEKTKQ